MLFYNFNIMVIESFIKELRESADIIYNIFTLGSCFKLYKILKVIYPESIPYWSDRDNHCITKINNDFYDIGGKVNKNYILDKGYYPIPENQLNGYDLLKYHSEGNASSATIEKYKDE